jgi:hypothetical protein
MQHEQVQTDAPQTPGMSLMGRMANILVTPSEVFDQVKRSRPCASNWLVPALILIVVSWIGGWVIMSQDTIKHQMSEMAEKGIQKQIEKQKMPPEQAEKMRAIGEKYGSMGAVISMATFPVLLGLGLPFFWGLILWLLGRRSFPYMKAVEVVGLGNTVAILEAVVRYLLILVKGNLFAGPSLVLLINEFNPENLVHGALALVDIMIFWILTVRAIGLSRLSGMSCGKALFAVFGIWLAYRGLFLGLGAAMRAAFGG